MEPAPNRDQAQGSPLAELSLLALTCITVVGMSRLFIDNQIVPYLLATAILGHGLAAGLRRLGWNTAVAVATNVAVGIQLIAMTRYPDTLTARLIPSGATVDLLRSDLSQAWGAFSVVRAPTETLPGFVVVSMVAVWLLVQIADVAAFRVSTTLEAIVPMGTIFIFTSLLDNDRWRLPATITFMAAVLAFSLTHRGRARAQAAGTQEPVQPRDLRSGAAIALATVLVAAIIGPRLPGVDQEPLLNWRELDNGGGGGSSGVVLSPLVDARGRIVSQSDRVMFTVRSDTRSYWRTASLDIFDGAIWRADFSYLPVEGALPAEVSSGQTETIVQQYEMQDLSDIWLPAAFTPVDIEVAGNSASFETSSSTLILAGRNRTERGLQYTVVSQSPRFTPDELRAAPTVYSAEMRERYITLPQSFTKDIRLLAESITRDADNNYDKAIALQSYFREFTYDINVADGHSNRRIADFLQERRGYCEQFAGTFAAMARHLGIPSRVALGFTPGDEIEPGLFEVRGMYYHAWPELYFPGSGWVPFEPTPNRGAPFAEQWTNIGEAQASLSDPNRAVTPETAEEDQQSAATTPTTQPDLLDLNAEEDFGDFDIETGQASDSPLWINRLFTLAIILLVMLILWAITVPLLRIRRSRKRHGADVSSENLVLHSWEDVSESLALMGIRAYSSETRSEFAKRVSSKVQLQNGQLREMATMVDRCTYRVTEDHADELAALSAQLMLDVERELAEICTTRERIQNHLDPRPLLPSWPARLFGGPEEN